MHTGARITAFAAALAAAFGAAYGVGQSLDPLVTEGERPAGHSAPTGEPGDGTTRPGERPDPGDSHDPAGHGH